MQRYFKLKAFAKVAHAQLQHFADDSDKGYGTVNDNNVIIHVSLVMGKGFMASLKGITIPTMELAAAVLATGEDKLLTSGLQLHLDSSMFWTNSQSVIKYISNEHFRYKAFVANRVAAIRDATELSQWEYVDSKSNPADDVMM